MGKSYSRFRRSEDGAKWVKNPEAARPTRPVTVTVTNTALLALLADDAQGDLTLAILIAVRNLLWRQENWCKTHRAQGPSGLDIETTSGFAQRWSMFGALDSVTSGGLEKHKVAIIARWKAHLPADARASLGQWEADDSCRHTDVVRVLNLAIGARKKELG